MPLAIGIKGMSAFRKLISVSFLEHFQITEVRDFLESRPHWQNSLLSSLVGGNNLL